MEKKNSKGKGNKKSLQQGEEEREANDESPSLSCCSSEEEAKGTNDVSIE